MPLGFLPQLPRLTALTLDCTKDACDALLASLVRCRCITDLCLQCGFKSAHWSALFAKLSLKKLTIRRGELETLQCFAAGPITQSLEELAIAGLALPPAELSHLYGLHRLRSLALNYCFSSHLDDATLASLFPPTAQFPRLVKFRYLSDEDGYDVDRQGLSFEWMQSRLTQ